MTRREYVNWMAYIERNGPLNPMLRMDRAIARLAVMWAKDATMADFMPWPREPDTPEVEVTPMMVAARLTATSSPKRGAA